MFQVPGFGFRIFGFSDAWDVECTVAEGPCSGGAGVCAASALSPCRARAPVLFGDYHLKVLGLNTVFNTKMVEGLSLG